MLESPDSSVLADITAASAAHARALAADEPEEKKEEGGDEVKEAVGGDGVDKENVEPEPVVTLSPGLSMLKSRARKLQLPG